MSRVYVPRMLIQDFVPHPEPYGEAIVVLLNGMFTDVYTDDNGDLFTVTNDEELITYLLQHTNKDELIELAQGELSLQSIRFSDIDRLTESLPGELHRQDSVLCFDEDNLKLFISHSTTFNSHLFIIRKSVRVVGLIGYDVMEQDTLLTFELFKSHVLTKDDAEQCLKMIIDLIKKSYHPKILTTLLHIHDDFMKEVFSTYGFYQNGTQPIKPLRYVITRVRYIQMSDLHSAMINIL